MWQSHRFIFDGICQIVETDDFFPTNVLEFE